MTFELPVMEEKVKSHQITALHLLCAFVLLGIGAITHAFLPIFWPWSTWFLIVGALIILLNMFANKWILKKVVNTLFRIVEILSISGILLIVSALHMHILTAMLGLLDAVLVFATFWELSGNKTMFVSINEKGFKLPVTSRRRSIDWRDIEQVLLRHGILTVNCVDNRLFQWNIHEADIDREIFEAFCEHQVEANKGRRIADW